MRHALGILGVLSAGVLLAVSAAMNWRFGYSLGKTEFDGQIYGAASAAADCLKALLPFFLFAAWRNRMWSQAAAAAVVWVVVTAYSLTSALGHAALNRLDTAGQRAQHAAVYQDARAELKRLEGQVSWIPQHRPAQAVVADMEAMKHQVAWSRTKGCSEVTGKTHRDFCSKFQALSAEHANATQAAVLGERIAKIKADLAGKGEAAAMSEADPQAAMLAKIGALAFPNVKVDDVQMALTIFVAIMLEIGSAFGMYVACAPWRMREAVTVPVVRRREEEAVDVRATPAQVPAVAAAAMPAIAAPVTANAPVPAQPAAPGPVEQAAKAVEPAIGPAAAEPPLRVLAGPVVTANDNAERAAMPTRTVAPESDVKRFHREMIEEKEGSTVTATDLYDRYCEWCEEKGKEPLALPTFGREFAELPGIRKATIGKRVRYIGMSLRGTIETAEDKKLPITVTRAA